MTKILIVTRNNDWADKFSEKLRQADHDVDVYASSHDNALARFLAEEPDVVLVNEYYEEEDINQESWQGRQMFDDVKMSAVEEQTILRCGFFPLQYNDYLQLPFGPDEILDRL
jgi:DNA-binding response OmpR family regulator